MGYSESTEKFISAKAVKYILSMVIIAMVFVIGGSVKAYAADDDVATLATPKTQGQIRYGYDSSKTHPFGKQTNQIIVRWYAVDGAKYYQLYIKGGEYTKYTKYTTVLAKTTSVTVKNLERAKNYSFRVRAVSDDAVSKFSATQSIRTARIDFSYGDWQALCRIVYHEVGGINDDMWDKPIVYVSDCVVNQYEAAKYTFVPLWANYYKKYTSLQNIIYQSGGFLSSAGLARDGAVYSKVPLKVKLAAYGACYGTAAYKGIKNTSGIYYWCNRSYRTNSSRIAYTFKIPWGYFNIWKTYWG